MTREHARRIARGIEREASRMNLPVDVLPDMDDDGRANGRYSATVRLPSMDPGALWVILVRLAGYLSDLAAKKGA